MFVIKHPKSLMLRIRFWMLAAPQVPNAPHSGLRADRDASRLVRPGKMIKNVPVNKFTVPYFDHFSGVLF